MWRFEIYQSTIRFRWQLRNGKKEVVAESHVEFPSVQAAHNSIKSILKAIGKAKVVNVDEANTKKRILH